MQHERDALRRRQHLEHDLQRGTDRVGELEVMWMIVAHDLQLRRQCFARLARAQHVETHARDDGRQPAAQVLDLVRVGARRLQPRLLHGVVRVARGPEDAVRHGAQVAAVLVESLG